MSLALTAPIQRFQREAELNRRCCVGESIIMVHRPKVLGIERHASTPIGREEAFLRAYLEFISFFARVFRSPKRRHNLDVLTLSDENSAMHEPLPALAPLLALMGHACYLTLSNG